jgi:hypothetical protein
MGEDAEQFDKVAQQKVSNKTDSMHPETVNRGEA